MPTLFVFGGLPGTGKTTLAQALARLRRAVHVRIDTIEQALRECGSLREGPEGYLVAYGVAADNLRAGLEVVADSVNPLRVTREAWRDVARKCGASLVEIEVICSDRAEHRQRVESRAGTVPGLRLPTWEEVVTRDYEPWPGDRIVLDTAGQRVGESIAAMRRLLEMEAGGP